MKKLLLLLCFSLAGILPAFGVNNYTTVTASNIQDASNHAIASGQLCFQGTNNSFQPVGFQAGGGGQVITRPVCTPISNGAIGTFVVPNPAGTHPAWISYTVTIAVGNSTVLKYVGVQWDDAATFNFDLYVPNIGPLYPFGGGGGGGSFSGAALSLQFGSTVQNLLSSPATAAGQCLASSGTGPFTWAASSNCSVPYLVIATAMSGVDIGQQYANACTFYGSGSPTLVWVPAATYTTNHQVPLSSNCSLEGYGKDTTVIVGGPSLGANPVILGNGTSGSHLANIHISGITVKNGTPSTTISSGYDGIVCKFCDNTLIEQVHVTSIAGYNGIEFVDGSYNTVKDSTVDNFACNGIENISNTGATFTLHENNVITGAGVYSGYTCHAESLSDYTVTNAVPTKHAISTKNKVSNMPGIGCIDAHNGQDIWFVENTISDCYIGFTGGIVGYPYSNNLADGIHIRNNTIIQGKGPNNAYAISLTGYLNWGTSPVGVGSGFITNSDITGNVLVGFGSTSLSMVLSAVSVSGSNATYTYSSFTGTGPTIFTPLTISGFSNSGNNVSGATITAVTGTTSGTFTVAKTTQVNETHAGAAVSTVGNGSCSINVAATEGLRIENNKFPQYNQCAIGLASANYSTRILNNNFGDVLDAYQPFSIYPIQSVSQGNYFSVDGNICNPQNPNKNPVLGLVYNAYPDAAIDFGPSNECKFLAPSATNMFSGAGYTPVNLTTKPLEQTQLTLTQISVTGGVATFNYSGFVGTAPFVTEAIGVSGFTNSGNNTAVTITGVSGGSSGTFTAASSTQVNETHAGSGVSVGVQYPTFSVRERGYDAAGKLAYVFGPAGSGGNPEGYYSFNHSPLGTVSATAGNKYVTIISGPSTGDYASYCPSQFMFYCTPTGGNITLSNTAGGGAPQNVKITGTDGVKIFIDQAIVTTQSTVNVSNQIGTVMNLSSVYEGVMCMIACGQNGFQGDFMGNGANNYSGISFNQSSADPAFVVNAVPQNGADWWTQVSPGSPSFKMGMISGSVYPWALWYAVAGKAPGTHGTFWGSPVAFVDNSGNFFNAGSVVAGVNVAADKTSSNGFIVKAPNGTCYIIQVNNTPALTLTSTGCL